MVFFLSGQALTPPLLVAGPLKKDSFFAAFPNVLQSVNSISLKRMIILITKQIALINPDVSQFEKRFLKNLSQI